MLSRPSRHDIADSARDWNLDLTDDELDLYTSLSSTLVETLDQIVANTSSSPVVDAERLVGSKLTEVDDPLNAIVRTCSVRGTTNGVLSGKNIAMKDSMAVAGIPMTCGSRILEGFVPTIDSVVTDRILRAGGHIVAITNMDDFAASGGGQSSTYGPTLNPYDLARTTGGSSGGSAASLHYDGIDIALGTDQGGSIRLPAAWCGVVGLKPTHGLVSYRGIAAIDATFDHVGPMARTTADLAAALEAIVGYDPDDPRQRPFPPMDQDYVGAVTTAPDDLRGLRVGIVDEGFSGAESETIESVEDLLGMFRRFGAEVVRRSIPAHLTAGSIANACCLEGMAALIQSGGNGYHWIGEYWPEFAFALRKGLSSHASALSAEMKITLMLGTYLRREYFGTIYAQAQNLRTEVRLAYDDALGGVDVLAMPTAPYRAYAIRKDLAVPEQVLRGWQVLANTTPTDVSGHPAITLPLCEVEGLPIGIMFVGRHFEEAKLLRVAASCEKTLGWRPRIERVASRAFPSLH